MIFLNAYDHQPAAVSTMCLLMAAPSPVGVLVLVSVCWGPAYLLLVTLSFVGCANVDLRLEKYGNG